MTAIAGIVGNALEWYDFLLYAYFAAILAPLFFPAQTPFLSLLMMLAVFAVGFFARPLGALVIGSLGDKIGRKKTLVLSMVLMTGATTLIGLLPTYATLGFFAPLLLVLVRCLQGFSVAGEVGTATAFLVEHANQQQRGLMGSFVVSNAYLGVLLAALLVTGLTTFIPHEILTTWGWRIPFLLAAPLGIIGFFIRWRALESPKFSAIAQPEPAPAKSIFLRYPKILLCTVCLTAVTAVGDYFLIAYFTTYLTSLSQFPLKAAMVINSISLLIFLLCVPLFGALSDRFGRKRIFLLSLSALMLMLFPVFWLLSQQNFLLVLLAEVLFAICLAGTNGLILTILAEAFPTPIRNSGITITYNIALAVFGGTVPFIAVALVHFTGFSLAPAVYGIALGLVALLAARFISETYDKPLLG